jgi:hypothetical protein
MLLRLLLLLRRLGLCGGLASAGAGEAAELLPRGQAPPAALCGVRRPRRRPPRRTRARRLAPWPRRSLRSPTRAPVSLPRLPPPSPPLPHPSHDMRPPSPPGPDAEPGPLQAARWLGPRAGLSTARSRYQRPVRPGAGYRTGHAPVRSEVNSEKEKPFSQGAAQTRPGGHPVNPTANDSDASHAWGAEPRADFYLNS